MVNIPMNEGSTLFNKEKDCWIRYDTLPASKITKSQPMHGLAFRLCLYQIHSRRHLILARYDLRAFVLPASFTCVEQQVHVWLYNPKVGKNQ